MDAFVTLLIVFAVVGVVVCAFACVGIAIHVLVTLLNTIGLLPSSLVDSAPGTFYDRVMYCRANK